MPGDEEWEADALTDDDFEVETDADGVESDGPEVPVVCTACETTTRVPLDDVAGVVDRHNEQLHDGAAIAEIDPALREAIADLAAGDILDVE